MAHAQRPADLAPRHTLGLALTLHLLMEGMTAKTVQQKKNHATQRPALVISYFMPVEHMGLKIVNISNSVER